METAGDTHTVLQMSEIHQISDDVKTSIELDNISTSSADQHSQQPVLLSSGKPLKGILKHRHHPDNKTHLHIEHGVEIGAVASASNEKESLEKPRSSDNIIVDTAASISSSQCFVYVATYMHTVSLSNSTYNDRVVIILSLCMISVTHTYIRMHIIIYICTLCTLVCMYIDTTIHK